MVKRKCTVCDGIGVIAAGPWTTIYEASDCEHCGGSGDEPTFMDMVRKDWWQILLALILFVAIVALYVFMPPSAPSTMPIYWHW